MQHIRLYERQFWKQSSVNGKQKALNNIKMLNLDCEGKLWDAMRFQCARLPGEMENTLFFGIQVMGKAEEWDIEEKISSLIPYAGYIETSQVENRLLVGCRGYDPEALYFGVLVNIYSLPSDENVVNETDILSL
jgi:hypothetical protein